MEKGLSPLMPVVGNIGSGVIALMMLLTVGDIVGRRFLPGLWKEIQSSSRKQKMLLRRVPAQAS